MFNDQCSMFNSKNPWDQCNISPQTSYILPQTSNLLHLTSYILPQTSDQYLVTFNFKIIWQLCMKSVFLRYETYRSC